MNTRTLFILAGGILTLSAHAWSAEPVESPEKKDILDIVSLADPRSFGLQLKHDWTLAEKAADSAVPALKNIALFHIDALTGYEYHPKAHANVSFEIGQTGRFIDVTLPPTPDYHNNKASYPFDWSLAAGLESAPVKPVSGTEQDWRVSNANAALKFKGVIPYSDAPAKFIASLTSSKQLIGGLFVEADAAYLKQDSKTVGKDDGFRGTVTTSYAFPLFFETELYGEYNYTWGKAQDSDKQFYTVQLSRYFAGTLSKMITSIVGDETPRLFVRYYEGGTAPTYTKSRGYEFGVGTKLIK